MHIHAQPRNQTIVHSGLHDNGHNCWAVPYTPSHAVWPFHREPDTIGDKVYTNNYHGTALGPCSVEEKVKIPEEQRCNRCCSSLGTPKTCLSLAVTCPVLRQHLCCRTLQEHASEELPIYRTVLQCSRWPPLGLESHMKFAVAIACCRSGAAFAYAERQRTYLGGSNPSRDI